MTNNHRIMWMSMLLIIAVLVCVPIGADACFPCIEIPGTGITITPVGPAPTVAVKKADEAANKVIDSGKQTVTSAANAGVAVVTAGVSHQIEIVNIIAGKESLSEAGQKYIKSQGNAIASVGQAVSDANATAHNAPVIAAQSVGGDVGKTLATTLNIVQGENRLNVEFVSTALIETGGVVSGKWTLEQLKAAPLAAGIRAAEKQFEPESQPLPAEVKAKLASFYPAEILNAARWAVGSVTISVPDVTNQFRKTFQNVENAVTVGHITVFVRDPGTSSLSSLHWWAHELQHQVQYSKLGIDEFALLYVKSCPNVESEAENQAERAVPVGLVSYDCPF